MSPADIFASCRCAVAIVSLSCLAIATPGQGQQDLSERPRIGLVLSGGGARGAAHAGVLSVLEELRVPVDCVVGTSMGAVVGGLYAYGMSPEQLETVLTRKGMATDWSYLLHDGPVRQDLTFRRKEDERRFLSDVRIGVRDGAFAFPKGLLQGQNLEVELHCLTMAAHALRSFDELPLPFRCVAVDIGSGEQVVLGAGSLPDAIRASMSLPGIFTPAVIDGRELVDGGPLNNVPVDVARALGVDVLIVVDIGTPLEMDRAVRNLFDVAGQMIAIMTEQNVRASRASITSSDVLMTPDLGDITSANFERAAEAIAIGTATARSAADRLRKYSVSEAEWARFLQKQRRVPLPLPKLRSLQVSKTSGLGEPLIEARLGLRIGEDLDEAALRIGCERLYGTDDLARIGFTVKDWRDGAADLAVSVEEKQWGPSYVRMGISLESNLRGDSSFNLSAQLNNRVVDSLGAELRTRVQIGNDNLLDSEYYQPFDVDGHWFLAPKVMARGYSADEFVQGQKVADVDVLSAGIGIDGGAVLDRWGEARIGLQRFLVDVNADSTTVPVQEGSSDDTVLRSLLQVDTLDNARFPHSGSLGMAEWRVGLPELGADERYQQLLLSFMQGIPLGDKTTLLPRLSLSTALQNDVPLYSESPIGGFLRLSGYAKDTIRDQHTGVVSLIGHHRLSRNSAAFGFPVYVGGSVEAGNAWSTRAAFGEDLIVAGSAFVGVDTPFGPCFLAYGQAEGGERSIYFFLGPF